MKRLVALVALLAGLLATALLLAGPASAHASVVGSDPVDGSRLKAAPHTVTISFDEPVGLNGVGYLHVIDQQGKKVDAGPAYHPGGDATKIADNLTGALPDGTYTASYRVISADSHPVAGVVQFVVGSGPLVAARGGGAGGGAATSSVTGTAFDVARWVTYAGFALLGGSWLLLTVWPGGKEDRKARRIVWTGWTAAVVGAVAELLLQGPYSDGAGLAKLASGGLLADTLRASYGELHSVRLMLLGVLALLLLTSFDRDVESPRREAVWLTMIGVALTISATGHAATTSPSWLSVPLDMAHLLAMSTWVGGLAMLAIALVPRKNRAELEAALPTYSTVAFTSVVVLAGTGTYAAFRGIGTADAFFTTTYGLLVFGKIVLFLGLVGLGNLSRLLVRRHYARPVIAYAMTDAALLASPPVAAPRGAEEVSAERLRRAVWVETVVSMIVLALTAVLVAQPRGKEALLASYHQPITRTAPLTTTQSAVIRANTGTHGEVEFTVAVPGRAYAVAATATDQAAQLGPLPIKLQHSAGFWTGSVDLPVAGDWQIELTVSRTRFDATTTDTTFPFH